MTTTTTVAAAAAALDRARRAHRPPSELRTLWHELDRELTAAVAGARSAGYEALHRARTALELHRMEALSDHDLRLPNVARTASRGATGPHIAGMVLDPTAPAAEGVVPTYGLDLAAALDGPRPAAPALQVPQPRQAADEQPVAEPGVQPVGATAG